MGIKTVRICDVTGQDLVRPVRMGFVIAGQDIVMEVNQEIAQKFVLSAVNRLSKDDLLAVLEEVFGQTFFTNINKDV